ncbi:DUF6228 family protein [Nonomuraea cavernae]|uniref:DUF6228 family protein n=1 Tax=Nonomuraea cavernae TaxID=2045107 RepID=UPI001CD94E26|nr:DUF6228 family protein [Nonomuraea cavernae]
MPTWFAPCPASWRGLVVEWRGWNGVRCWTSLEREFALDAPHDGRGHVSLGVTLRALDSTWMTPSRSPSCGRPP